MDYGKIAPGAREAMRGLEKYVESSGQEPSLLNLPKTRASQVNGCAWRLDMHTKSARVLGETEQRLFALSARRETPFFTARERTALSWTEAVTLVSENHVPEEAYDKARKNFTEKELVDLTLAAVAIRSGSCG